MVICYHQVSLEYLARAAAPGHVPFVKTLSQGEAALGVEAAPIDPNQEVWAAGVTYLRSREAGRVEFDRGRYVRPSV